MSDKERWTLTEDLAVPSDPIEYLYSIWQHSPAAWKPYLRWLIVHKEDVAAGSKRGRMKGATKPH